MNKHLCLFTDSLEPSGVGEVMLTLAGELQSQYRVSFVCPPNRAGLRFIKRARALDIEVLPLKVRRNRKAWETLRDWLRAERVDIFHGHAGIGWEGHDGIYAARAAKVPVVLRTEHLPDLITLERQRRDYYRMVQFVDRLVCVSEGARSSFEKVGVPPQMLRVVRNGINPQPARLDRSDVRRQLGLPADARLFLTVARLTEQKGHALLLDAIPTIVAQHPNAYFVWVGSGPLKSPLQARVRELGLDTHVRLLRRRDVRRLLSASEAFVLPSRFEGFPLVVLEAMAAGLPVIGTRVCGISEAVTDGMTGRLVETEHAPALASAILELLGQPELAAHWGHEGRRRVLREFTAKRMAREMLAVYQDALREVEVTHALTATPAVEPVTTRLLAETQAL